MRGSRWDGEVMTLSMLLKSTLPEQLGEQVRQLTPMDAMPLYDAQSTIVLYTVGSRSPT